MKYRCDFCVGPDQVLWDFPARDFYAPGGKSVGGWAACDTCHDLVEAADWGGLARRSVKNLGAPEAETGMWVALMLTLHAKFNRHRAGDAYRTDTPEAQERAHAARWE